MKKTYLFGLMAAAGLMFTACSSEEPLVKPDDRTDVDRTYYVNMNIRGDVDGTGSRAGAEDNGTPAEGTDFSNGEDESQVKKAYFVFYDASGNMVGQIVEVNLNNATVGTNASGTVEKYYQSVVPVSVNKGESTPTQVICYLNPITPASLQNPLNVIETNTRDILYSESGSEKYFAMSNSVYYPKGEGTTTAEKPQITVNITKDQLFNTEAEAKAALTNDANAPAAVVDIYVERYASKLAFTKSNVTDYVTATSFINNPNEIEVTLTFVPRYWALNAACQESYVVKSFRKEGDNDQVLPESYTFTELNSRINASTLTRNENGTAVNYGEVLTTGRWDWNNYNFHRSYWAMSPAYFTAEYPEVSADVTGNETQKYYSYNELEGDTEHSFSYAHGDTDPHYFHETTVGGKALTSKNPAAAVASVILVGDYKLKIGSQELTNPTFYTYLTGSAGKPLVYFEALTGSATGESAVPEGESMIRRFIEQISILFKKDGNNYIPYSITDPENTADLKSLVAMLEISEPKAAPADMKIAERYRTLQFKEDATTTGVYVATTDGYKEIGNGITLAEANLALMQQVGFCVKYVEGAGYFNIPVKHFGWYREGNEQKNAEKINWNLVRVGDFGMVRNHSYNINVEKIEGLATGIGGKANPIVPPSDTQDYFVAYRVNILKWAVVPTQNTKL